MRPDSSWSATFRNRSRGLVMLLLKLPASSTLENASSSDSLQHSTAYSLRQHGWRLLDQLSLPALPLLCPALVKANLRCVFTPRARQEHHSRTAAILSTQGLQDNYGIRGLHRVTCRLDSPNCMLQATAG
jgi:hypothetical protein